MDVTKTTQAGERTQHTPDITYLWPDDLKHSLAVVVSIIANHAGARDSSEWIALWEHFAAVELQRAELLESLKIIRGLCTQMAASRISPADALQSIDAHAFDAISKAEGR